MLTYYSRTLQGERQQRRPLRLKREARLLWIFFEEERVQPIPGAAMPSSRRRWRRWTPCSQLGSSRAALTLRWGADGEWATSLLVMD